ncbi:MAG: nucleotidyltransferase family protein [Tissierellales bacterium]|jgi:uncharacterized protein|nr:nucleotidyltransferase family protein [Tissierellales bacterium]MBN2827769.1 nucleotidyltransferase family protein [Tissierellales bacterium]
MYNSSDIMKTLNNGMSFIERFHVSKIGLFGSFARNEQTEDSDVDILVEFKEGQETFDNYMDLKFYLEDLFQRKVDLVIFNSIKPSMKRIIMESVRYAKGA